MGSDKVAKAKDLINEINTSPTFKKMKEMSIAERSRWQSEIASLQERVKSAYADIDLGDGTTIAVRLSLTEDEVKRMNALEQLARTASSVGDDEAATGYTCESLEIITANPLITKEWLLDNRDKYSPSDLMRVVFGFMEVRLKENEDRLKKMQSAAIFRDKKTRAELR